MDLLARLKSLFGGSEGGKAKPFALGGPGAAKKPKQAKIDVNKRFELVRQMGQGSMSKVWQARDKSLGRIVCLKLLDKVKTAKFEARFMGGTKPSEGEICSLFRHDNIVQTYEHGVTTDNQFYIVMELIEGMGLNFLVDTKSDKLNGKRVKYLIQLAEALEYVHAQGYLHRDICPRNVMVTSDGVIKLIDFGLAVPNTPLFNRPGNRTGTPNYLAPELIRRVTTDHRVDCFALGVTAYELFTFNLPWEKGASLQTLLQHVNNTGKDPREFLPDLDEGIRRCLRKAVERDPRDRYQSMTEFKEVLKALPRDQ